LGIEGSPVGDFPRNFFPIRQEMGRLGFPFGPTQKGGFPGRNFGLPFLKPPFPPKRLRFKGDFSLFGKRGVYRAGSFPVFPGPWYWDRPLLVGFWGI